MTKILSGGGDASLRGMRNVYEKLFGRDVDAAFKKFDTNQDGRITWYICMCVYMYVCMYVCS